MGSFCWNLVRLAEAYDGRPADVAPASPGSPGLAKTEAAPASPALAGAH